MAKILIIEDNKDLNAVYRLILEHEKHQVVTAFDGQEGMEKLAHFKPDIILLDLIMPRKSGVEFLREAHLAEKLPDTKVLVFTNLDHGREMNQALGEGIYQCAIKARTTPEGLVRVVKNMLAN